MTGKGDDPDQPRPPLPGEDGWSATTWPNSAVNRPTETAASASSSTSDSTRPLERPGGLPLNDEVALPPDDPAWPTSKGQYEPKELGPADRDPPEPPAADRPDPTARFGTPAAHGDVFGTDGYSSPDSAAGPDAGATGPGGAADAADAGSAQQPTLRDRLQVMANRLTGAARVERLDDSFSFGHLFGSSFKRRSQAEVERELMVGTETTTPPLSSVSAEWPQPWLFARTLLASSAMLALFFVGWSVFASITLLPGLIIVGSFAMPIAVLIFFFEANIVRNVSIVAVLRIVFLGGAASLVFSLIGFELLDFPWLGAMVAGVVEEPAKLLAVVLIARQTRHRFILNGILFGAAIGAGFAAFESAGYALVAALFALDNRDVIDNILLRGLLSPFGHVVWTAITAGALWRVKGSDRLRVDHLKDPRFWRIMVLAIVLHTTWNSPIPNLLYIKFAALGVVAWLVCLSLLQEGIGQVRREQADLSA